MLPTMGDSDLGGFGYGLTAQIEAVAPEFARAYRGMVKASRDCSGLSDLECELIGLAVNAAPTHMNREAARRHIERALELGASEEQIAQVLQLASCLGIHTIVHGVPRLAKYAPDLIAAPRSERQVELKKSWEDSRGFWPPSFEGLVAGDPDFYEAALDFQNGPAMSVEPRFRELVFTAIDASTTHMYDNVDRHIELALEHGATPQEVLATLEITALIGMQGYTLGMAVLEEVRDAAGSDET